MSKLYLLLLAMLSMPAATPAQSGTLDININDNTACHPTTGQLPAGNYAIPGCFASINEAANYVNSYGIGGPVQFDVAAGHTETAPAFGITLNTVGGGSATNTVKFVKAGSGANPLVTAPLNAAGGIFDAVIKIGGDYITFDGIDVQENAGNTNAATGGGNTMTEFGYALVHESATDGAQNNTIQNCVITLSPNYPDAVGIFSTSASTSTGGNHVAADATSTAGTNLNNKIYGNTINTVAVGVLFICPPVTAGVFETGTEVGGSTAASGNTITYGHNTASSAPWNRAAVARGGIVFRNGAGNSARYNIINSISTLTAGSAGVLVSSGTAPNGVTYTTTISNNRLTVYNNGPEDFWGINFGHGIATGTIVANENSINLYQINSSANTSFVMGIKANYASANNTLTRNNIIINQSTSFGTLSSTVNGINASGLAASAININFNTITVKQTVTSTLGSFGGSVIFIDVSASISVTIPVINVNNNNMNSAGSIIKSTGLVMGVNHVTQAGLFTANGNVIDLDCARFSNFGGFNNNSDPSSVGTIITNNRIRLNHTAGSANITGINEQDGLGSSGSYHIVEGNTIEVTSGSAGTFTGINNNFSGSVGTPVPSSVSNNRITYNGASASVNGISSGTGTYGYTYSHNVISLTSSAASPSITGMRTRTSGNARGYKMHNNNFTLYAAAGGNSSPTMNAIVIQAGTGDSVYNNIIHHLSTAASTGNAIINGVLISGSVSCTVFKNKIYNLSTQCTGASTLVSGITISGGTTSTLHNNFIGFTNAFAMDNADGLRGINITATNTNSTRSVNFNTIYLDASSTGANFGSSGIYHAGSTTSTTSVLFLRSNIIVNISTPAGSGLAVAYRRSTGAANTLANYGNQSNNNLFYAGTPLATNLIYSDGAGTAQTLNDYKSGVFTAGTVAPRDAASVTELPPFLSTAGASDSFLHINEFITTLAESGGVAVAGVADDYDGDTRNATTPDIGADEFPPQACTAAKGGTANGNATACSSYTGTITATGYSAITGGSYQWVSATSPAGPWAAIGGATNPAAYIISTPVTVTTYYKLAVACATNSSQDSSTMVTITINPKPSVPVTPAGPVVVCQPATQLLDAGGTNAAAPLYQWLHNDAPINNATSATYTASAYGNHRVKITDGLTGCFDTSAIALTIKPQPGAPVFTPAAPVVCAGTVQQLITRSSGAPGPVIFTENFNTPTNGWTTINNSTGGNPAEAAWTLRPSGYTFTDVFPVTVISNDNSRFYMTNGVAQGSGSGITAATLLQSPAFSTVGYVSANLDFYQYYAFNGFPDSATVEVSTDGSTWQYLRSFKTSVGNNSTFINTSINLDGYAGQPTVYIRFRYEARFGRYWGVDDIRVTGNVAASYAWTPATHLFLDPAATIAYTGGSKDSLFVQPAGPQTYTVSVAVNGCTNSADVHIAVQQPASPNGLAGVPTPGATTEWSETHTVNTAHYYTEAASCNLISKVLPSGALPVSGNVRCAVRVDSGAHKMGTGALYAARFYAIEPVVNTGQRTATITLYYLQSEFDNFNQKAPDSAHHLLPTGPGDAAGISNLLIRQYHVTPIGGYWPNNYIGTNEELNPADANVVWNAAAGRWEVTVPINGFSGFFLTSKVIVVPVRLLHISGEMTGHTNTLYWTTSQEQNNRAFIIERSTDGRYFTAIGETASRATNGTSSVPLHYSFVDAAPMEGKVYYRLQMVSLNGSREQSPVVTLLRGKGQFEIVDVRPNPTSGVVRFNIIGSSGALTVVVRGMDGKEVLRTSLIPGNAFSVDLSGLASGLYILEATSREGEKAVYRVVRE